MNTHQLNEKFESLPYYSKREVLDYIEFLTKRQKIRSKKVPFTFRWEGGLKDIKEHFSSVDLQHKVRDYR